MKVLLTVWVTPGVLTKGFWDDALFEANREEEHDLIKGQMYESKKKIEKSALLPRWSKSLILNLGSTVVDVSAIRKKTQSI